MFKCRDCQTMLEWPENYTGGRPVEASEQHTPHTRERCESMKKIPSGHFSQNPDDLEEKIDPNKRPWRVKKSIKESLVTKYGMDWCPRGHLMGSKTRALTNLIKDRDYCGKCDHYYYGVEYI